MSNENQNEDKPIEGHEYDGIRELDNPLPGWWLTTFYLTVIFAVIYWVYYQFGSGPTSEEYLMKDMESIQTLQAKFEDTMQVRSEDSLLALVNDQEALSAGKAEYIIKCAACHGAEAQGLIGPNMTDDYWIHGDGSITSILKIANEGVLDKGMPPWKGVIDVKLLEKVSVYIYSIRGSNPPGAKPPQGEKITK
ncbi:MAG TPA: cbb3-type cytochrome c oxidase N-terminal domain-containing protein [Thermodesulfobacteriota bacterium]|nr:cbb3-type cytochrome c oxidase N-terminal domain-containing protein [Thermodesulfobacteriota bacterium]